MAGQQRALTIYRIREAIAGTPVTAFEDAIANPQNLTSHDLAGDHDFEARLFVAPSDEKKPPWVEFLEPGFGELTEVADAVTNSAVLVLKVRYYKDLFFGFAFGFGRYLLKPDSYVRNYGLRAALNAIYPSLDVGETLDPARVRAVDAKTVAANTLHTRRQADRRTTFETFGIDVQSDLLKAVTGWPTETDTWGTRIGGADALHLNRAIDFRDLGKLCRQIERIHRRDDYRDRFAWVDNIHAITDPGLIADLDAALLERLKSRDVARLELAPPELVEWDETSAFRFSVEPDVGRVDLALADYLDALETQGKLAELTIRRLRTAHRVEAWRADGEVIHRWSVFRCLSGELELGGSTYLVSDGDFFEAAADYVDELNDYIKSLQEAARVLPLSAEGTKEADYNEFAANSSTDYLLLDKRTVRVSSSTSPIEICDIMTDDGCFIHVKRKLGSSSLSHLFAQGYVSSDLFLMSSEYRQAVLQEVQAAEEDRVNATGDQSFRGRFSTFDLAGISPGDYEVVYAIVAKWNQRELVEALPFFSKVNLRRYADDLRRLGYRVSYKRVRVA